MSKQVHDRNLLDYEATRQTSKATNNNAAGHIAADIVYYTAVLKSGQLNGVRTNAMQALINLGATLPALTGEG